MKHFLFHLGDRGVLNGLSCFHCFSLFCCFGLSPWIAFGSRRCYLVPNLNPKWANALDFFQGEPLYISTMRARSDLCNFVTQFYLEISCCKSIEYLLTTNLQCAAHWSNQIWSVLCSRNSLEIFPWIRTLSKLPQNSLIFMTWIRNNPII